jgi:hypothetical protein
MALLGVDLSDRLPYGIASDPVPWEFKGHGKVTGTVKNTPSTPVYRLLRLYREPGGMLVASGWSDPVTGAYSFTGLNMRYRYTVISFDHTGLYRAVIADNQTPELMP